MVPTGRPKIHDGPLGTSHEDPPRGAPRLCQDPGIPDPPVTSRSLPECPRPSQASNTPGHHKPSRDFSTPSPGKPSEHRSPASSRRFGLGGKREALTISSGHRPTVYVTMAQAFFY